MGAWRMRPPKIKAVRPHCWAASIASWSEVTKKIPKLKTSEVISRIKLKEPDKVTRSGALVGDQGLLAIAKNFGFKVETTEGMVTRFFLEPKLKKSYVVLIHKISHLDTLWHAVLCYGVDRFSLCFMDPLSGKRVCVRQDEFALGADTKVALWLD